MLAEVPTDANVAAYGSVELAVRAPGDSAKWNAFMILNTDNDFGTYFLADTQ